MAADSTLNHAKALQFIEEMTRNAYAVQEHVLAEILSQNSETEYLKGFDLSGATDREAFESKIPMVTYEEIQPLIQRISNGDRSPILSSHPISEFLTRYKPLNSNKIGFLMHYYPLRDVCFQLFTSRVSDEMNLLCFGLLILC